MKLDRYKQNLKFIYPFVYSYNTKVAEVINDELIVNKYYSPTTSKHISYVAHIYNYKIVRNYL